MPETAELRVQLAGRTEYVQTDVPWEPHDGDPDGPALAEFAGRACYGSWSRPNPATATNDSYIRHILDVGHESVLEHSHASFYITGVSRSLTHELIRHRHTSPSQLSQRYVPSGNTAVVVPDVIADDAVSAEIMAEATDAALSAYDAIVRRLARRYGSESTTAKKLARQAARAVLPNAAETRIVLTGNYRAWRHLIALRATPYADREIRALAVAVLRELQRSDVAAPVFADFRIERYRDHPDAPDTEIAWSSVGAEPVEPSGDQGDTPSGACPNCEQSSPVAWQDPDSDRVVCRACCWEGWQDGLVAEGIA